MIQKKNIPIFARSVSYIKEQYKPKNKFNLYFWRRSLEQNPVQMSVVHTKFNWKKVFACAKITISVRCLPQIGKSEIFSSFKPLSILKFAMIRWFLSETCFIEVFLSLPFYFKQFYVIFIMRKIAFYHV